MKLEHEAHTNEMPRVFTVREVSTLLNLSIVTIKRYAREGRLPGFKIGQHWFFNEAELVQQLRAHPTPVAQADASEDALC